MVEELIERGALELALSGHSEEGICEILKMVEWKLGDYRYQDYLMLLLSMLIDMYSAAGPLGNEDSVIITELKASLKRV